MRWRHGCPLAGPIPWSTTYESPDCRAFERQARGIVDEKLESASDEAYARNGLGDGKSPGSSTAHQRIGRESGTSLGHRLFQYVEVPG